MLSWLIFSTHYFFSSGFKSCEISMRACLVTVRYKHDCAVAWRSSSKEQRAFVSFTVPPQRPVCSQQFLMTENGSSIQISWKASIAVSTSSLCTSNSPSSHKSLARSILNLLYLTFKDAIMLASQGCILDVEREERNNSSTVTSSSRVSKRPCALQLSISKRIFWQSEDTLALNRISKSKKRSAVI